MASREAVHLDVLSPSTGLWTDTRIFPLANGGIVASWRDITEQKRRALELAAQHDVAGPYLDALTIVERLIPGIYQRELPINASGSIPAVLLQVGFPVGALKGIPILARTAGLLAHLHEEAQRPIGFLMCHHAEQAIAYDGPRRQGPAAAD